MNLKILLLALIGYSTLYMNSCTEDVVPVIEVESEMEEEIVDTIPDPKDISCGCGDDETPVFLEKDGLLSIEMESADYVDTAWKLDTSFYGYNHLGYLAWRGINYFNSPGTGTLTYKIRISTPGRYHFVWRSYNTVGMSSSDYNDSWLRIPDADHFYGERAGHIVYPKGTTQDPIPISSGQETTVPNGSSSNGWFKVYMGKLGIWRWQSSTSDNDGHDIYAVFDTAGDYTVEISARSKGHGIDRFVLYNDSLTVVEATSVTELSNILCD